MNNQHQRIKGYRDLSEDEIGLMNSIKDQGIVLASLVADLRATPGLDQHWINMGCNDLQKGLMFLIRGVAQPTTF